MRHEDFMRRAIELASLADGRDGPFGSVVVNDGRIVGEGVNVCATRPDPTAHAEVEALRQAARTLGRDDLSDCVLYTSCEPCAMCAAAIHWADIAQVYYAASVPQAATAGFSGSLPLNEEILRPIEARERPATQMMSTQSLKVMSEWIAKQEE